MTEPIRYRLTFPERAHHYVEVEGNFPLPAGGRESLELAMAVWTPGSYLLREFAKHVEGLVAADSSGAPRVAVKVAKNRWRIEAAGASAIVVRYRLYGRGSGVQDNAIGQDFALLNGAATFLAPVAPDAPISGRGRPYEIRLERPEEWTRTVAARPALAGDPDSYGAADFDELVDSPVYLGNATVRTFVVAGREHLLVDEGAEGGIWNGPRGAAELERIVRAEVEFWGEVPYERFVFFNLVTEHGGGLEHRDSTVLSTSRWKARSREGWLDWISLAAHEYFHVWNVKRLRPAALGPFDYEREAYTTSLWAVEGITSYYDDRFVRRAGLASDEEYLKQLSKQIELVQTSPGRLVQSLADSSFDAWIKLYRRDENARNSTLSYYPKGAVVAFLLDVELRRATAGARSLDDLMRAAWGRFAGERGFEEAELRALAAELAGVDLSSFFRRLVDETSEIDWAPALDWLGLRFHPPAAADAPREGGRKGWFGARFEERAGQLRIVEVVRGTPAWSAGLDVDDELVAIGGFRVQPANWPARLEAFPPGTTAPLVIARRERLGELEITFGEEPDPARWQLEIDPAATPEQVERRRAWLGAPADLVAESTSRAGAP